MHIKSASKGERIKGRKWEEEWRESGRERRKKEGECMLYFSVDHMSFKDTKPPCR